MYVNTSVIKYFSHKFTVRYKSQDMTSEYKIEIQNQEITPRLIGTLLWVISTLTSSYPNRTYTIKCHIKTSSLTSLPQNLMRAPYQSNNTSYAKIKQLTIQFQ